MRLTQLFTLLLLLFVTIICAKEDEKSLSEFAILKAAVNSIVEIFIELVQHAGPIGTFVGMTALVLSEMSSAVQENEGNERVIRQLDYDKLGERMDALKYSVDHLLNEVKFQTLIEYQSELNAEFDHFRHIILAFASNESKLYQELSKFVDDYKAKNIENKIANYLNADSSPARSLRTTLVDFAASNKNNTACHLRSSPNKLIYDFHVATLLSIYKGNMLLLSCYAYKDQISKDESFENHKKFIALRNIDALHKIVASMKASLPLVDHQTDLISYNDFHAPVKIEFKNVLQLFLEFNTNLRTYKKRVLFFHKTFACEEIHNDLYDKGDGCFGTVEDCTSTSSTCLFGGLLHAAVGKSANYFYDFGRLSEDPDRIYSQNGSRMTVWENQNYRCNQTFSKLCACFCDQHRHPRTERSLYAGAIRAPEGYVITGVRFQKHFGVIYLQAQIGEFMSGAFVNKSSVHWLEPPDDMKANVLNFTYERRTLLLESLYFDDAVLIGFQFFDDHINGVFQLKIFGKKILKPGFSSLDEDELIKSHDEKTSFSFINLSFKFPGLNKSVETVEGSSANSSVLVRFGVSDRVADAGQTFIPFLDGVDATFEVESPLAGIGLMHYTNDVDYAGYIRPYLRSFNYRNILAYYENYLESDLQSLRNGEE